MSQLQTITKDEDTLDAHEPNTEKTSPDEEKNADADFKPGTRFYLAFASLMLITLMVALDGTSISVALPIITRKLHGDAIQAFWAGTSFLLTSALVQPLIASLSHIFGRRPLVFVTLAFFLVGAIVAAISNNFTVMIVGRVIQGLGGGGIIALVEILVTDLVPLRLRGNWFGLISAMWSLGSVTGPVIGGAFAQTTTWRWIFWINLPFIGICVPMVWFFLKMNFKESALLEKIRRVDWVGIVLFVGSCTSFLVPLTWGGVMYAWDSWRTLVPLLIGVAGFVGFMLWEVYLAKEQLIRLSIFQTTTAKLAFTMDVFHGLLVWCILYYLPLYYEGVKEYSPIISGVSMFPATFTVAPLAAGTGILISYTGHYRWIIIVGWAITTFGSGLLYLLDVHTSVPAFIFLTLIFGVGLGVLFASLAFAIQAASTEQDMAFAVAMFAFFRTMGEALGVAIGGVIFQNEMVHKLRAYPEYASRAQEFAKDATSLVQIIKAMDPGPQKDDLRQAYADSIKVIWAFLTGLAGVCLILSWFIKSYDLNRALGTEQGFQHENKKSNVGGEEGSKE